jgi:alkylated DNA repair dioxygenase AlkB
MQEGQARRRSRATAVVPGGLKLIEGFLTPTEEAELLAELRAIDYAEVRMRGYVARRRSRHYGWIYRYDTWHVEPSAPIPGFLLGLRERAAAVAGLRPEALEEALINYYPPGAGIGWHRDAPQFGPEIIGVSLGSDCMMSLRREAAGGFDVFQLRLARRSLYVLGGAARSEWQHHIATCPAERWSVSFRTLRRS